MWFFLLIILVLLGALYVVARRSSVPEIRWDWGRINLENLTFPHSFMWGVTSGIIPGDTQKPSNWSAWRDAQKGDSAAVRHLPPGVIDWSRTAAILDHLTALKVKAYRFGLAWSDIEPRQAQFEESVIRQYADFCTELRKRNIEPVVTLHHLAAPLWFEALGGFEKVRNIEVFVAFAEKAFSGLNQQVRRWITFHQPAATALQGWYWGNYPPGKQDLRLASKVLANLLDAHTAVYHRFKKLAGETTPIQIGLTKQIRHFDPARRWHPLDWVFVDALNRLYRDEVIHYLAEGVFDFQVPGFFKTRRINPLAKGALDFIGLDYFTHEAVRTVLDWRRPIRLETPRFEPTDDISSAIYPEGLYTGIRRLAQLKKPIYITANGLADSANEYRAQFIRRHLYAVRRAIAENYPVKGYFYYSLTDQDDWRVDQSVAYGLLAENGKSFQYRPAAEIYRDILRPYST